MKNLRSIKWICHYLNSNYFITFFIISYDSHLFISRYTIVADHLSILCYELYDFPKTFVVNIYYYTLSEAGLRVCPPSSFDCHSSFSNKVVSLIPQLYHYNLLRNISFMKNLILLAIFLVRQNYNVVCIANFIVVLYSVEDCFASNMKLWVLEQVLLAIVNNFYI